MTRFREKAQSKEKFDWMVTFMDACESEEQLEAVSMLYVGDLSYPRPDILLAMDHVKKEKGW